MAYPMLATHVMNTYYIISQAPFATAAQIKLNQL